MDVSQTDLPEVLLIKPRIFPDSRGRFLETWQRDRYADSGVVGEFVQDNVSRSVKGTLRGLHFQEPRAQGKLIMVLSGTIFDVAVDVRRGSPRFGDWVGITLDSDLAHQLWIPPGFAHGFCVMSETVDLMYKCTDFYSPSTERTIKWDDPDINIDWPIDDPILSDKDEVGVQLAAAEILPEFVQSS
ncbi:MAG: dTDP-4-dehydrorhamnose 3,5-epimerase [Rhodospirillaceae bacterium]|nr:dTDP-4-dehydrorhamnose 3,5-epimerase [Rhodospirillaceae bacterium]